jgi:predicted lipoprotein with Yx(FWY)xxD motif
VSRIHITLAGALACAAGVTTAVAGAYRGAPAAHAARAAKVELRRTEVGRILVTSSGFTLYRFSKDTLKKDTCIKVSGCAENWPPLRTKGKPVAGRGVKSSLLGTIRLPSGASQVTYAGHPLYTYAQASERGETVYIGADQFGGIWYAVNAAGHNVK